MAEKNSEGLRVHTMDWISDKDLFKAVRFAASMISKGTRPGIAHHRAAKYYGVSVSDVAHYSAQHAGTIAGRKNRKSA